MYIRQEAVGNVGDERVISVFTSANVKGFVTGLVLSGLSTGLLGLGGVEQGTSGWWVQYGLILGGGVLGGLATIRWSGLSLWDQVRLWASYQVRQRSGKTLLVPSRAGAGSVQASRFVPVTRDGQIIAQEYDPAQIEEEPVYG